MGIVNAGNQLQPNFFEIELFENHHDFYVADYSEGFFRKCVSEENKSFFYHREGNQIYALPEKVDHSCPGGFRLTTVSCNESPYLFAKFISNSFNAFFRDLGRDVYKKKYSAIWSFTITSEEPISLGLLELIAKCEYSIHPLQKNGDTLFLMTLAKEYKPRFSQEIENYSQRGIDLRDWDYIENGVIATRANIKKYLDRSNSQTKYDSAIEWASSKEREFEFLQKTFLYLEQRKNDIGQLGLPVIPPFITAILS